MSARTLRAVGGGLVGAGVGSLLMLGLFVAVSGGRLPFTATSASVRLSDKAQLRMLVQLASQQHSVPAELLWAMMEVESRFDSNARSHKGAQGLMQLMPATARAMNVSDPLNPLQSIDGGARYLKQLLARFKGREELAVAAYNAGPRAVERHRGVPPFPETRAYVRKVMRNRRSA